MSGALRLAAKGQIDKWFTDNPDISHFLVNFKRHSKFSMEQVEIPCSGTQGFGSELFCSIPYSRGDILRNIAIRFYLNDIYDVRFPETQKDTTPDYTRVINVPYVPSLCSELIETADLLIGGQVIQRLTGEYIYMYQQLNNTQNDVERSLKKINGHGNFIDHFDDDSFDDVFNKVAGASSEDYKKNNFNTYIIDLPFYFFREPSLAIPMCALTKQRIEVRLKLKTFDEMIFGGKASTMRGELRNVSLEGTFGFLDSPERNYLMTRPIDYVITQLQLAQFNMEYPETKKTVKLNLKNPVKELFFVVQNDGYKQFNNPLRFQKINKVELRLNNQLAIDGDHEFIVYGQATQNHINIPSQSLITYRYKFNEFVDYRISSEFGTYSFALNPAEAKPTGQVNFSRISHQQLTIEIEPEIYQVFAPQIYKNVGTVTEVSEGTYPVILRHSLGRLSPGRRAYVKSKDNKVRVYALSYNLLRVNGGIAGLKF